MGAALKFLVDGITLAFAALLAGALLVVMAILDPWRDDTPTQKITPSISEATLLPVPEFKGTITHIMRSKAIVSQQPLRIGTSLSFRLHFINDSVQKAAIEEIIVTVTDTDNVTFEDQHPSFISGGMPITLPTKAYERGDPGVINVTARFGDLEYDKVNKESLIVRFIDNIAQATHVIRSSKPR